jgi:hypothetical protein
MASSRRGERVGGKGGRDDGVRGRAESVEEQGDDLRGSQRLPVGDHRMAAGKGHHVQPPGGLLRLEAQLPGVRLDQPDEGSEDRLGVVGVAVRPRTAGPLRAHPRLPGAPQRVEHTDHPAHMRLQRLDGRHEPVLQTGSGVHLLQFGHQCGGIEGAGPGGAQQLLLGVEDPEDRALGDTGGLGDLTGADVGAARQHEFQRRRQEHGPAVVRGECGGASRGRWHDATLRLSEDSLTHVSLGAPRGPSDAVPQASSLTRCC